MNWDSGLGFQRWHQAKKLGLTQQALIGIASPRRCRERRSAAGRSSCSTVRSSFYERTAERDGGHRGRVVLQRARGPAGRGQRAARRRAGAGQCGAGARRRPWAPAASEPPALYAYDPDIGRLAVTTPTTTPRSSRSTSARSLRRNRPGAAVQRRPGGRGDDRRHAAGVLRRGHPRPQRAPRAGLAGRPLSVDRGVTPLRLTKAPRGAGASAASSVGHAFAGPFTCRRPDGDRRRLDPRHPPLHPSRSTPAGTSVAPREHAADVLFPSTAGGATVGSSWCCVTAHACPSLPRIARATAGAARDRDPPAAVTRSPRSPAPPAPPPA